MVASSIIAFLLAAALTTCDATGSNDCIRKHLMKTTTAIGCTSVNLHGADLGPTGVEELRNGIQAATNAEKIELGGNSMGDDG